MKLIKAKKRILIIVGVIVAIILIIIIAINLLAGSIIEAKIQAALEKNKTEYRVEIKDVGGNIFFGNIRLKGIKIKPDSSLLESLKDGTAPTSTAFDIEIPLIRLVGIGMYDALVHTEIEIRNIEIKRAKIKIYKGKSHKIENKHKQKEVQGKRFDPDSIYLENLNGISIGKIALINNEFQVWDIEKDEEIIGNKLSRFEITDFYIRKYPEVKDLFYLDVDEFEVHISNEEFEVPGGDYKLSMKNLDFAMSDTTLRIKGLKFKPTWKDKYKMAAQWKFTKEIYDVEVKEINIHSINLYKLVVEGAVYIDSITVNNLNLNIFKDKRYPFDESKRPILPQQSLKTMEMPLYIGHVKVYDSKLQYQEKTEGSKDLMTVILGNLNGDISFITSVKDSIRTEKPMKIKLWANMMNKPILRADFELPLHSKSNIFYFSGSMGGAPFKIFNKVAFPAIGAKFSSGKLNGIQFKASATTTVSNGEMTMLYEGLHAEIVKKDQVRTNKFISWAANTVLKKANPGANGKTRVAVMKFDRVMYKGFGNFVWKTLQSGIVNSILPASKKVKDEQKNASRKEKNKAAKTKAPDKEKEKKKNKKNKKK